MYGSPDCPIQLLAVNQDRGTHAATILKQLDAMKGFAVETTWVEVLPKVGVLAVFALVFFAIGVWRFRFE